MQIHDDPPTLVEAFLLVEQPRQRISHWTQALAALDASTAPPLASVHAFYDSIADQAVLQLRYDALALGTVRLGYVVEVALLAEVGMIQPAELSEGERSRFLSDRLARCTLHVSYARDVVGALTELVKRIKDTRGGKSQPPPIPLAKGTRDDLQHTVQSLPVATTTSRHVIPRPMRSESPRDALGATPYMPTTAVAPKDMIYARYLRGGRWVPIRVGALSLKGAALMSGALPRLHDRVEVALSYGTHRALVRGEVGKISSVTEAAATGASTFSVQFEHDSSSRAQLTELLTAARTAKVTIKPAPARATRRFPVELPLCVGTTRGAIKADALDVSVGGMFVRPAFALDRGSIASFSMALDDELGPVGGRVRVVRHIADAFAKACGVPPGFGLGIVEMTDYDRGRWSAFLARVEKRSERRVVVGAPGTRLGELQVALESCGYVVTGGTDPGAIVQLARASDRPVDAALFDAGWLSNGASSSWVESLFSARGIPCATALGDARRARGAIDRILDVV
ncbi:MAG TPA: PilZ domain-containing protein [Kofleriaceae bacterium]